MRKQVYRSLEKISYERKINDKNISDELKNEYITELLCFLCYFKCGKGYEDSYTVFRALPRRKYCNDIVLTSYINNISYHENSYSIYGNDTFYFSINSFMKKYGEEKRIICDREMNILEVTNSLKNLRTINCIAFDIDFKDCNALKERFSDNEEILKYILEQVDKIITINAIVYSGNGCHLYFNINNIVIPQEENKKNRMVMQYKNLCKTIADEFAKYDIICDQRVVGDVCRILRVPYSYNTKTDNYKQSYIYYTNYCEPHSINNLFKKFNIKKIVTNNLASNNTVSNNSNNNKMNNSGFSVINNGYTVPNTNEDLYTRNTQTKNYAQTVSNRLEDIKKFVSLKKDYEGRRTTILSMTAIMLNDANEKEKSNNGDNAFIYDIEREIDTINGYFSVPLSDEEVKSIKENYKKYKFKYKTTNIYWSEVLGLTSIDMTYSKEIINKTEAERRKKITEKRRNKKHYEKNKENISNKKKEITSNKKQEKIKNEDKLVTELINQGKTNKEIAEELKFSVRKVQMIKARINKN